MVTQVQGSCDGVIFLNPSAWYRQLPWYAGLSAMAGDHLPTNLDNVHLWLFWNFEMSRHTYLHHKNYYLCYLRSLNKKKKKHLSIHY